MRLHYKCLPFDGVFSMITVYCENDMKHMHYVGQYAVLES
jgi:hypothetical protein